MTSLDPSGTRTVKQTKKMHMHYSCMTVHVQRCWCWHVNNLSFTTRCLTMVQYGNGTTSTNTVIQKLGGFIICQDRILCQLRFLLNKPAYLWQPVGYLNLHKKGTLANECNNVFALFFLEPFKKYIRKQSQRLFHHELPSKSRRDRFTALTAKI